MRRYISKKLLIVFPILLFIFLDQIQNNLIFGKETKKFTHKSSNKRNNSDDEDEVDRSASTRLEAQHSPDTQDSSESDESSSDDQSGSSSDSSEYNSDDNNETSSDSSDDEQPSTSTQIGKKRKKPHKEIAPKRIKLSRTKGGMIESKKAMVKNFILNHHLTLLIAEIDIKSLRSKQLFITNFWLEKNKLLSERRFVFQIFTVLSRGDTYLKSINSFTLSYYFEKISNIKKNLVPGYENKRNIFDQLYSFKENIKKIKCDNVKLSYIIISLIFWNNQFFIFNGFLLYILLCSFHELENMDFSSSLIMVLKNQDDLGAKVTAIGGEHLTKFIDHIKYTFNEYSKFQIQGMEKYLTQKFPINFKSTNVESFGLNLCLSLLELHILNENRLDQREIFLFFGSRFNSPSSVLLANDIYKVAKQSGDSSTDTIFSIIHDGNIFEKVKKWVLEMHGLDLKDMKNQFSVCIKVKESFVELTGIQRMTDVQLKSIMKTKNRDKVKLNLKYPFLN